MLGTAALMERLLIPLTATGDWVRAAVFAELSCCISSSLTRSRA